ncbi:MAG: hypothetical protein IT285_08015 [Bdellovibrionales bacterium]|nr:hypothetical protein [Bdellovibrionales bacterium]
MNLRVDPDRTRIRITLEEAKSLLERGELVESFPWPHPARTRVGLSVSCGQTPPGEFFHVPESDLKALIGAAESGARRDELAITLSDGVEVELDLFSIRKNLNGAKR